MNDRPESGPVVIGQANPGEAGLSVFAPGTDGHHREIIRIEPGARLDVPPAEELGGAAVAGDVFESGQPIAFGQGSGALADHPIQYVVRDVSTDVELAFPCPLGQDGQAIVTDQAAMVVYGPVNGEPFGRELFRVQPGVGPDDVAAAGFPDVAAAMRKGRGL